MRFVDFIASILGSRLTTIVLALGIAAITSATAVAFVRGNQDAQVKALALADEAGTHENVLHAAYAFDPDDERQLSARHETSS